MIEWLISTIANSNCTNGAVDGCGGISFGMTIHVHSVNLIKHAHLDYDNQRLCVNVSVGDRSANTELRYSSSSQTKQEDLVWSFNDILNLDVSPSAMITIKVLHTKTSASRAHDPLQAWEALAPLMPETISQATISVTTIRKELQAKKDIEGYVYVSPKMSFDLFKDGVNLGNAYLSFETKQPPKSAMEPADGMAQVWAVSDAPIMDKFSWVDVPDDWKSSCCPRTIGRQGEGNMVIDAHVEDVKTWEGWAHKEAAQDFINWGHCTNDIVLNFSEPEKTGDVNGLKGLQPAFTDIEALGKKANAEEVQRILLSSLFARVQTTNADGPWKSETSNVVSRLKEVASLVKESGWELYFTGEVPSTRPGSVGFRQSVTSIWLVDDKWRLPVLLQISSVDTPFQAQTIK